MLFDSVPGGGGVRHNHRPLQPIREPSQCHRPVSLAHRCQSQVGRHHTVHDKKGELQNPRKRHSPLSIHGGHHEIGRTEISIFKYLRVIFRSPSKNVHRESQA